MKKAWLALIFGSALFLAACGGDDDNGSKSSSNDTSNNTTETTTANGEELVNKNCTTCHGGNLEGVGSTPALKDVGSRLSEAEILEVIEKGRNAMPGGLLKGDDAKAAAAWLATQK